MCQSLYAIWYSEECCWDNEYAQKSVRSCHWLETTAMVAAAALFVLSALAFSQTGTFTNSPAAVPFGLFCLATTGAILLIELIYKAIIGCRAWLESEKSLRSNLTTMGMPRIRLKKRASVEEGKFDQKRGLHSPHKPTQLKVAEHTDLAVRQGFRQKLKSQLVVDLKAPIDEYLLECRKWLGAAEIVFESEIKNAYFAEESEAFKVVGVYEHREHRGEYLSVVQNRLLSHIEEEMGHNHQWDDTEICDGLCKVKDRIMASLMGNDSPSMPTFALILDNAVYFANCGDSRICLIRKETIFQLTEDKTRRFSKRLSLAPPEGSTELHLDENAYHLTSPLPMLKITAIYKDKEDDLVKGIISYQEGDYLICANKEYWDRVCNANVLEAMKVMREKEMKLSEMAAHLLELAARDQPDKNMTVLVVPL